MLLPRLSRFSASLNRLFDEFFSASDSIVASLDRRGNAIQPCVVLAGVDANDTTRSCVDPLASGFGGILWNVQKHRRSLEKRDIRKFGYLHWGTYKQLRANRRLRHDHKTGEVFELGRLPPNRYRAVMEETREIQRRMADAFGLEAKDKEVAVVYKGEEERAKRAATDRVKLVEMEKERPAFFSPNLLQKVHRPPSAAEKDRSTTTVRPSGLG